MAEVFLGLCIIGIIVFAIWVLVSMDSRVKKKIFQEAKKKNLTIKALRDAEKIDGKNPFGAITIWGGVSSRIFGISGEQVFDKIVITKEGKYWVQVKMTLFIPVRVQWKKR